MSNLSLLFYRVPSAFRSFFESAQRILSNDEGLDGTVHVCASEALWSVANMRVPELMTFSLTLGKNADIFAPDFFVRQKSKIGENCIIPRENLYQTRANIDPNIEWDESCVVSTKNDPRPYTRNLSPCIAVLMRAFDASDRDFPAYLSVTHVFTTDGVTQFQASLQELMQKTHRKGIEIFLCGGNSRQVKQPIPDWDYINLAVQKSKLLYEQILDVARNAQIAVTQDLVGLADAEGQAGFGEKCRFGFYIQKTGFDKDCKPYAVIDVSTTGLVSGWSPSSWWVLPKLAQESAF